MAEPPNAAAKPCPEGASVLSSLFSRRVAAGRSSRLTPSVLPGQAGTYQLQVFLVGAIHHRGSFSAECVDARLCYFKSLLKWLTPVLKRESPDNVV